MNEELLKALELANIHAATAAVTVTVQRAREYYGFLKGDFLQAADMSAVEEAKRDNVAPQEPGTKKARKRTDKEIHDLADKTSAAVQSVDVDAPEITQAEIDDLKAASARTGTASPMGPPGYIEILTSDPAAEYKKIQQAVVDLMNRNKREKVVGVLERFGIATMLKLTPDQYPEALALLGSALAEQPLA